MEDIILNSYSEFAVAPSKQYSNHLYHFDREPDRIIETLKHKGFTLNYVIEDFSYLNIKALEQVAFPMLCFCDIPDKENRLESHKTLYGKYGIGLTKNWGNRHGIQPVHYIVPQSPFACDLKQAIETAFSINPASAQSETITLSDFLVTILAYAKPLWGLNDKASYCFEDECEWRFIPSDLAPNLPRFIPHPGKDKLENYQKTLWRQETYLLEFGYEDISSIFVAAGESQDFCNAIDYFDTTPDNKNKLKMKIREE